MKSVRRASRPQVRLPKKAAEPKVEISQQIKLAFEEGILQIFAPIRVNGVEMVITTGIDVTKIPDVEWQRMQEARSKISLVIPQGLKIVH